MTKFVRIVNGAAVDVITTTPSDTFHEDLANQFVNCPDEVEPGWVLNKGVWSAPVVAEPAIPDPSKDVQPVYLSKLEFMELFTDAELAGIYSAASQNVSVQVWLDKLKLAEKITLTDTRTVTGIQSLEAAGLIAAGRSVEILSNTAPI